MAMGGGRTILLLTGPLELALALAVGPVAWAGPSCQVERSADAFHRLEVWGRELAGAKGLIAARSTRHVAMSPSSKRAAARCWRRCSWSRCKTPAIRPGRVRA